MVSILTELTNEPRPGFVARRFVRGILNRWQVPSELLEPAELVVSELVGNAVKHADGATTLRLSKNDAELRIEVCDRGAGTPVVLQAGPLEEGHRGLFIVQAVSTSWGCQPTEAGKTVWATFCLTSSA
ncbi:MAG: ATP-binding protein [Sciscionella sp.]